MFYWPFDRSMGQWIINEILKRCADYSKQQCSKFNFLYCDFKNYRNPEYFLNVCLNEPNVKILLLQWKKHQLKYISVVT